MDIGDTIAPRADQQNYEDYIAGPRTVTISDVKIIGDPKQPVHLMLAEYPGRPYKPNLTMRRLLVAAWGADSKAYVGRQMTLYGDASVEYGGAAVGGIKISHLSNLDGPVTAKLMVRRGKPREDFTVLPLSTPETPAAATAALDNIDQASSMEALKAAWQLAGVQGVQSHPDVIAAKDRRKAEIEAGS